MVMKCKVCLMGNHDQAALFDPTDFNPVAERAILWTRAQLEAPVPNRQAADRRWEFLAERPRLHREEDYLYVHGSASNPLNEYVFPEDIYKPQKMDRLFTQVKRYCFQGHTHVPGIFTQALEFYSPEDVGSVYPLDEDKLLCNVGSVGQPRDGDPRACYVLLDGHAIKYQRVEYDVETAIKKIYAVPELNKTLGDRLRHGR
jgi:diadenosine tetraphosphatase ApaH/serine/threonine PP2A family protein phosphatase